MAILAANIVIVGYVYSAFNEEDDVDESEKRQFDNDASQPRVGTFKQRTD